MRLIDADALKKTFHISFGGVSHAVIAGKLIDEAPTVDSAKHAHVIMDLDGETSCSLCGCKYIDFISNYCQNCGAKLDEKEKIDGFD